MLPYKSKYYLTRWLYGVTIIDSHPATVEFPSEEVKGAGADPSRQGSNQVHGAHLQLELLWSLHKPHTHVGGLPWVKR